MDRDDPIEPANSMNELCLAQASHKKEIYVLQYPYSAAESTKDDWFSKNSESIRLSCSYSIRKPSCP